MKAHLKKYALEEAHVPFPMRGMGDEDSSWLSDEAYQTYSIRAGTAGWQEGLRRQLLLQRFRILHPDNPLNKTIWQHRLQKQYLKEEQERVFKKRKEKRERERRPRRERAGSDGSIGDMDVDDDRGKSSRVESLPSTLVLDPVAKQLNSSLTLEEHRTFLSLQIKFESYQAAAPDARPLTDEEIKTHDRLSRLVMREQDKYAASLEKWVEGSRSPYKALDRQLAEVVDTYLTSLKDVQRAFFLPRTAKPGEAVNWWQVARELMPDFNAMTAHGHVPPPRLLSVERPVPEPLSLRIPALPTDMSGRGVSLAPPDLLQDPLVSEWMKEEGEGGSDVVVGLRTLLSLADPTVAWTIPFENVLKADGTSHLTVIRSPLLPPVLTLRSLAELYFRRLVKSVLHAPSESAMDVGDGKKGEDRSVAYERWQLGPTLKVTVGTERVHLQGDKLDVEDALLEVDVDYTLEFSEGEMEVMPLGQIRRLLYAWLAVSCPVYRAVVDGKTAKLVKVEEVLFGADPHEAAGQVHMLSFLRAILEAMNRAGQGRFLARMLGEGDRKEVVIYKEGGGQVGEALDVRAYIEESGLRDKKAATSFTEWKRQATGDHVPRTFTPRVG